jgi:hypothetical protein
MYHWTDRKIRIHAFYCMLGISLLQHLHKQAQSSWNGIPTEQLLEELRQIQQFVLLYPPQGEKGANGSFCGTASSGGTSGDGTIFSLSVGLGPFLETQTTAGATTGIVEVVTPGGTLSSNAPFRVT